MAEAATPPTLTDDECAFMGYVSNMRPCVGKRFIQHLVREGGFDAFEQFWQKLRDSRYSEPPQIELDDAERKALAQAIHASSRRDFLRIGAGGVLCVVSVLAGRSAVRDIREAPSYRPMNTDEAMGVTLKLSASLLSGITGLFLMFKNNEPSAQTIAGIAHGEAGEKNVQTLLETLNGLFKPMELALHETGAKTRLS